MPGFKKGDFYFRFYKNNNYKKIMIFWRLGQNEKIF